MTPKVVSDIWKTLIKRSAPPSNYPSPREFPAERYRGEGAHRVRWVTQKISLNQTVEEPLSGIRTGVSQWWDLPQHKQTRWPFAWSHPDIYNRYYSLAWWMKCDGKRNQWNGGRGRKRPMKETKRSKREIGMTAIKSWSCVWKKWEKTTQTKWDVVDDDRVWRCAGLIRHYERKCSR